MKFTKSILLATAAMAAIASAAPLVNQTPNDVNTVVTTNALGKRDDTAAINAIVQISANHYADIAKINLDNLLNDIDAAKVTSGKDELPNEKTLLSLAVKANIEKAKQDCSAESLKPLIKATVKAETGSDSQWEDKDKATKLLVDIDVKITEILNQCLKVNINADVLSKDCTEKMTNTEIEPINAEPINNEPEPEAAPETPEPAPETTESKPEVVEPVTEPEAVEPEPEAEPIPEEAPAPVPEEALAPVPEETPAPVPESAPESCSAGAGGINVCVKVNTNLDSFICKSGCKDEKDAKAVLDLHINLKKELTPRLDKFYKNEVPTACEEKRESLVDSVLGLLNINAD
ncbi:hypothetical protein BGZ76_006851, partial [Entomortierella beljakovae]